MAKGRGHKETRGGGTREQEEFYSPLQQDFPPDNDDDSIFL